MQLLSAFSRPQTVPAVPKAAPKKTLWILNSWRDLILYVGTPLFLVPMFLLARARLCDLCRLVCDGAAAVAAAHGRHARNVSRQWRIIHSARAPAQRAASRPGHRHCSSRFVPVQFFPDVGGRETSQSGEADAV